MPANVMVSAKDFKKVIRLILCLRKWEETLAEYGIGIALI